MPYRGAAGDELAGRRSSAILAAMRGIGTTRTGRHCRLFYATAVIGGTLIALLAGAQELPASPGFTAAELTALPADGWLTNGGNLFNQRYSPLTQINRDTVQDLKAQWRTHLDGSGAGPQYSGQGQPLFYEGVLYVVTGADDVFALDIRNGAHLWTYEAKLDPAHVRVCCGWVSRGLGMGAGKIFVGRLDAKLTALDQKTGKVLWSIQGENPNLGYSLVGAPLYYQGMVIVGYAGGDMGIRGRVKAYDANDGHLLWTFYTVPAPGEFGSDTWPADNDYYKWGGAPVWQTPAIDPKLGMVYFSTGNAGPDYGGASARGITSSPPRSSRWMSRPASTAGISSRFITISGTMTPPIRWCCSMRPMAARSATVSPRSPRPAGCICSTAPPASRCWAFRSERCRRSRARRPRPPSPTRSVIRCSRSRSTWRRRASS